LGHDGSWSEALERLVSRPTVNIEAGGWLHRTGRQDESYRTRPLAKLDLRLVPDMTAAEALAALKAHLAPARLWRYRSADATAVMNPRAPRATRPRPGANLSVSARGPGSLLWPRGAGSWPGYLFTGQPLRLPAGHFGLGHGSGAHAPDEYYVIESPIQKSRGWTVLCFLSWNTYSNWRRSIDWRMTVSASNDLKLMKTTLLLTTAAIGLALRPERSRSRPEKERRARQTSSGPGQPDKPKLTPEELEAKFKATLTKAILAGRWCSIQDGKLGPEKEDKYTILGVTKVGGDVWLLNARIQYGQKDFVAPVPVQVKWRATRRSSSWINAGLPGSGTYSARVLIHEKTYAGSWTGGDHGASSTASLLTRRIEAPTWDVGGKLRFLCRNRYWPTLPGGTVWLLGGASGLASRLGTSLAPPKLYRYPTWSYRSGVF